MKNFAPAFTTLLATLALAGGASTACAQTAQTAPAAEAPAGGGMVSRFANWFNGWDQGWETGANYRVMVSPYTYHYSQDPDHAHVYMVGLERQRADGFVLGGVFFDNSFGQPSTYLYAGQRFNRLASVEPLFAQITGGLLYGYKPPYDKKVPLNYRGFSPGLVLSVGWQFSPAYSAQLNFLGNSALMFQFSLDFR